MITKAKRQWLSSVKKQREAISRLHRARRGTLYHHIVDTTEARAWEGNEGDGFAGSGEEARNVDIAEEIGGGAECSRYDSELLHGSDTEGELRCAQCGQCCVAPGPDVCDECAAEAAFVDVVMTHPELPDSRDLLAHDPVSEFGSLGGRKKSQDPRAFFAHTEMTARVASLPTALPS